MKKFTAMMLVLIILASLSAPVWAADATGSITINGASTGNNYSIYKVLDLESYDTSSGAYSYKVNAAWTAFFVSGTGALDYMSINDAGYVSWIANEDDETVAAFAKLALAFAKSNSIAAVASKPGNDAALKFENLTLGYYLVDSTMGALCGLTTTNPNASINAKNGIPTVDKQVKEDSTDQWGATNSADIGQIVEYRVTINVHAGAENYVLHDVMETGLTYQEVTKVEHVEPGIGTHDTPTTKYSVKTGAGVVTDGCTFEVHFTEEFCNDMETNDKIIIYYTAMLNENAVIAETGNVNTAWLSFGEIDANHKSNEDSTTTYTYGVDIVKTDSQNALINGAKFKIYDAATGGNEICVVVDESDYRRAKANETGVEIVVANGTIRVVGLDNGTYYLEEIEAPAGYNKLTARQKFIISDGNLYAIFNDDVYSVGSGVHVVNKTGSMLPETGGMGTIAFIVIGTIVVLGTGVLLVTKKRMSMIQE